MKPRLLVLVLAFAPCASRLAAQLDLPRSRPQSQPATTAKPAPDARAAAGTKPAGGAPTAGTPAVPQPTGAELAGELQRGLRGSGGSAEPGIGVTGGASKPPATALDVPAAARAHDASPQALPTLPLAAADQWLGALRAELAGAQPADASRLERAAGRLFLAGDDGIAAARLALAEDDAVLLLAGARALLSAGRADASAAVLARMSARKVPAPAALPLFELLGAQAPELLTDEQLVIWLAHTSASVRAASEKALVKRASPALVPALRSGLAAPRSEARSRAAVLLEKIGGTEALEALSAALSDASTEVAQRAANALADAQGEEGAAARAALAERVRSAGALDRGLAFGALALVLREERGGEIVFGSGDAPAFVAQLGAAAPLVRVVAALVLAGVGWRFDGAEPTPWLDREVPGTLVRELSGAEFHPDIAALAWPVQRRLARIAGASFGADGPAWAEWWIDAAPTFRARRAVIPAPPERADELALRYRALGEGRVFELCGPRATPRQPGAIALTSGAVAALRARLDELGLFGLACEPGTRPSGAGFLRLLELEIGGAGKSFAFGEANAEPWFEAACAAARETYEANAWQRLRDARAHPSQQAFVDAERGFWEQETDAARRTRRRVELALAAWSGGDAAAVAAARADLERFYAEPGVARAQDFEAWRARIAGAALDAADVGFALAGARAAAAAADAGASLGAERARALIDALLAAQPAVAAEHLSELARDGGAPLVLALAADPRAVARAAAAGALATLEHTDALEALRRLTLDRDEGVAAAALRAIGAARVTLLRSEVRTRCLAEQEPSAQVRAAALRALGALGAPPQGAVEDPSGLALFLRAFGDADTGIEEAAADGLARYGDPAAAPVLLSLLSRPDGSALERAGREGLQRLGAAAWADLLRVGHARTHPLRRKALLVLARQSCAQACSGLLELYTDAPLDAELAGELAVLTAREFADARDRVQAYWDWWDTVAHDDARAWWIEGAQRAGFEPPPPGALEAPVGAAGRAWIEQQLERGPECLRERARRELALVGGAAESHAPAAAGTQR